MDMPSPGASSFKRWFLNERIAGFQPAAVRGMGQGPQDVGGT